jgi:hypothetical protein
MIDLSLLFRRTQLDWIDVIDFVEAQKRKDDMKIIDQQLNKG